MATRSSARSRPSSSAPISTSKPSTAQP
jgi:hypothetical protein